jgi:dihydroorotase
LITGANIVNQGKITPSYLLSQDYAFSIIGICPSGFDTAINFLPGGKHIFLDLIDD